MNMSRGGHSSPGWELLRGVLGGGVVCTLWILWSGLFPGWPVEGPLLALVLLGFARPLPLQVGLLLLPCLAAAWLSALPLAAPVLASAAAFLLANMLARTEAVHPFDAAHAAFSVIAAIAYGAVFAIQHGAGPAGSMVWGTGVLLVMLWFGRAFWNRLRQAASRWRGSGGARLHPAGSFRP